MSVPFRGKLFILVGPAGTGKNTLMETAIRAVPGLHQLPTATTRAMRPNEVEGKQHFFLSREAFELKIAQDDLLEYQVVHGSDYYGMVRSSTEAALAAGERVIADIDYLGAEAARAAYPHDVVTIFITPRSAHDLVERMTQRGEKAADIARRLVRAPLEFAYAPQCAYIILNDDNPQAAAAQLVEVIETELGGERATLPVIPVPVLRLAAEVTLGAGSAPLIAPVAPGERPQHAALRALMEQRGGDLPAGRWQAGDVQQDAFVAPDALRMIEDGDGEIAVYQYRFCPAEQDWLESSAQSAFA